jgi:Family of unknown function (DUF6361)
MSTFVWLDYSERDRRKMLDVVDLFREHDTRDELGIGSVRDAFADMLFPGTSTIMTRARYFLLVPWTYQKLEKQRVSSAEIPAKARRAELYLVQPIEDSEDNDGNIGKLAKMTLKRLPSSVYWQGLGVWSIRNFSGAQVQYHRNLDRYYAQVMGHARRGPERDAEHDDVVSPNWHAGLVKPPTDFPEKCSLTLTRREAEYLAERISLSPGCAGSLLAELVALRKRSAQIDFPWEHPHSAKLPQRLREILDHAQNFSEVMHGAPLLYNLMLAQQARWKEGVSQYRHDIAEWAETIAKRARVLAQWDRKRFWEIVRSANPRITVPTNDFINAWWDLALAGGAPQVSANPTARVLISDRERRLKKSLARLDNPRAQELWNGRSGTARLEFRWTISQRLLGDIFDGLEKPDA